MAEYIEREAVTCRDCYHWGVCDGFGFVLDPIHGGVICDSFVKAADVVEVVHGRWELHGNDDDCGCSYFCSRCGFSIDEEVFERLNSTDHCNRCGARMDGAT